MPLMRAALRRLRAERGVTLIEVLVSLVIGSVTLMVILELVDTTQLASGRVQSRVDGTQRGRVAMEQVTQRLRSQVCLTRVSPNRPEKPVIGGDDDSVSLYVDLGDEAYMPDRRTISVNGGDLVEEVFEGTGTPPDRTFPSAPTNVRNILSDIQPMLDAGGSPAPYFRFFAFDSQTPATPTVQLPTPLSAEDAARVVRIQVAFRERGALSKDDRVDTDFQNAVTTRLADPTSPTTPRGPQCDF